MDEHFDFADVQPSAEVAAASAQDKANELKSIHNKIRQNIESHIESLIVPKGPPTTLAPPSPVVEQQVAPVVDQMTSQAVEPVIPSQAVEPG